MVGARERETKEEHEAEKERWAGRRTARGAEREAREGGGMLRSRGNRLPRVSEPLSFFLYLWPVSSRSRSFSIASSILSSFLCLSNTERAEVVSLPFHHSGSSCVRIYVCMYVYPYCGMLLQYLFSSLFLFSLLTLPYGALFTSPSSSSSSFLSPPFFVSFFRQNIYIYIYILYTYEYTYIGNTPFSLLFIQTIIFFPRLSFAHLYIVSFHRGKLVTGHRTHPTHCS